MTQGVALGWYEPSFWPEPQAPGETGRIEERYLGAVSCRNSALVRRTANFGSWRAAARASRAAGFVWCWAVVISPARRSDTTALLALPRPAWSEDNWYQTSGAPGVTCESFSSACSSLA